ncbi:MAG: LacI family DNA-binding transcriptional regulator [Verrucomicrobia bacterium]|nr:LacI family DNA-binding transcriptional regulator [Verrucomicrobiota bacterium]
MTVSLAMRNHPSIPESTRKKVQATADRLGYRPDPKLVAMMQYLNRRKQLREYPVLCFLNIWQERSGWRKSPYILRMFESAVARANALGTELQEFWLREKGMTARRMVDILKARGINGILLPPLPPFEQKLDFPFDKFCVVTTSYTAEEMGYHLITTNRHQIIRLALSKVKKMGYRRVGLVIDRELDRRSNHDVLAHFMFYQSQIEPVDRVAILYGEKFDAEQLASWYTKEQPDVVLSMNNTVYDWLLNAGVKNPSANRICFAV